MFKNYVNEGIFMKQRCKILKSNKKIFQNPVKLLVIKMNYLKNWNKNGESILQKQNVNKTNSQNKKRNFKKNTLKILRPNMSCR